MGPFLGTDLEREEWNVWGEKLGIPYFVPNQTHIVYAPLGHTTYLHCIVGNLGDRQVYNHIRVFVISKSPRLYMKKNTKQDYSLTIIFENRYLG